MAKQEQELLKDISTILIQAKENLGQITDEDFYKISKKVIEDVKNEYNNLIKNGNYDLDDNSYYEFLEKSINNSLQIAKNDTIITIEKIEEFIEKQKNIKTVKDALKLLNAIAFLTNEDEVNQDIKIKLITSNATIEQAIKKILNEISSNDSQDKIQFFNQLVPDYNTQEIIEMYMNINSIELEKEADSTMDNYKDDIIKQYMHDISIYPLLCFEEEQLLGILSSEKTDDNTRKEALLELKKRSLIENKKLSVIKAKNKEEEIKFAREDIITHNLKLCISYAKHFSGCGLELMDLVSAGNIGLFNAAEKFDYKKGFKFSTYAIWWIKQSMLREIQNSSKTIRKPAYLMSKINKYKAAYHKLLVLNQCEPSDEEILEVLGEGWDAKSLAEIRILNSDIISLSTPVGEEGDSLLEDFIPSKENIEETISNKLLCENINKIIETSTLDKKAKDIIKKRFGIGCDKRYTLEELGNQYGITRERVRQIERIGLIKLRKSRASIELKRAMENSQLNSPIPNKLIEKPKPIEKKELPKVREHLYGIDAHTKEQLDWNRYYLILSAYVRHNNNIDIPINFKTKDGKDYSENGYNIYSWANEQRMKFDNGELSKEKMDALIELGFEFESKEYKINIFKDFCISNSKLPKKDMTQLIKWMMQKSEEYTYLRTQETKQEESSLQAFGFDTDWIYKYKQLFDLYLSSGNPKYYDEYIENSNLPALPIVDWAREQYKLYLNNQLPKLNSELVKYFLDVRKEQIELSEAYIKRRIYELKNKKL